MSPFLAFRTFYSNELTMDYFYIALFSLLLTIILLLVVWITAISMKATRSQLSAMILGGVFMNSGNYGAPVVLFAFGAVGFDYAVIMMVFQSLLMNTVGIFFASMGGEEKSTLRQSAQRVIRMPLIYAAFFRYRTPTSFSPYSNRSHGSHQPRCRCIIPTVMLVLGMQLAAISRKRVAYRYVSAVRSSEW